ncbi:MAG: transcription termination factor NusA [Planctomycetota bacterium]|jgi:N utilization substance protein A
MQGKEILRLVTSLHRNKEIDEDVIFEAIESALQSAARKHFGTEEDIAVEIDRESGEVAAVRNGQRIEPAMLGRIAAQTAKQVIIQKIREAESETIYNEYIEEVGTLVTGAVQRFEGGSIIVNLEKTEAILPRSEQIPGEHYQPGERIRAIILDVRKHNNLVKILLSRASSDFIRRLFDLEVPEVAEGIVRIEKIAREPGLRTKVAVVSLDARVDCIGACVGVRGTRIKSIIDEVKGEKIDIIPWSEAPETIIADSLRPAEILQITLEEGEYTKRAIVTVPEDQLSWAIGWKGQNVRLAVKMSGWDIDIEPPEPLPEEEEEIEAEAPETAQEEPEAEPAVAEEQEAGPEDETELLEPEEAPEPAQEEPQAEPVLQEEQESAPEDQSELLETGAPEDDQEESETEPTAEEETEPASDTDFVQAAAAEAAEEPVEVPDEEAELAEPAGSGAAAGDLQEAGEESTPSEG